MKPQINFEAYLTNADGTYVDGSFREGHNVFTNYGRAWLSNLIRWSLVGDLAAINDVQTTGDRLRWISVGSGSQEELVGVQRLVTPLSILTGPTVYLGALGTRSFPTNNAIRHVRAFSGTDFAHLGASVTVAEAGLFVDQDTGGGPALDVAIGTHPPVAYITLPPLTKLAAQTLTVTWEFRF